jgi:hypothetical protein
MTAPATTPRVARSPRPVQAATRILVVSEDPFFIEEANAVLSCAGARVVGCLGPAHTDCDLCVKGSCAFASSVAVVLVDSPRSGTFRYHTVGIPAGEYAEALQRHHPETHVMLCGAPVGSAGPTGEIARATDRHQALYVLTRLLRRD